LIQEQKILGASPLKQVTLARSVPPWGRKMGGKRGSRATKKREDCTTLQGRGVSTEVRLNSLGERKERIGRREASRSGSKRSQKTGSCYYTLGKKGGKGLKWDLITIK